MREAMITIAQLVFTLFLYALGIILIGTAAFPGALLIKHAWMMSFQSDPLLRIFIICLSGAAAYFIYGITLIALVTFIKVLLGLSLKEGEYKIPSWGAAKWALTNSLVLVVAVTFMDFILLTPLAPLFFRLMGAKVGKNVQINSKNCADLSLLEIGDGAVIGGHATVIAHSVERGRIVLRKVRIGPNVVVGLNSVVLPGSDLGRRSMLAAGTVLQKDSQVGEREVYFGVPAQSVKERREKEELLKKLENIKDS
ncbi:MAG: hypothetical protein HQL27_01050 [Candidatus Omnitrophica bacterium]|nr:hypothetical protein [Candidatus Omnitrophota bacterium]